MSTWNGKHWTADSVDRELVGTTGDGRHTVRARVINDLIAERDAMIAELNRLREQAATVAHWLDGYSLRLTDGRDLTTALAHIDAEIVDLRSKVANAARHVCAPAPAPVTYLRMPDGALYDVHVMESDPEPDGTALVHLADDEHQHAMRVTKAWLVEVRPPSIDDPEPGPEVTAVRDVDGDLWRRVDGGWTILATTTRNPFDWFSIVTSWAPLTDATREVTP